MAAGRAAQRSSGSPREVWPRHVAADHERPSDPRGCSPHTAVAQRMARAADHYTADTTPAGCPARSTVSRTGSTPESPHQPSQGAASGRRLPPDRALSTELVVLHGQLVARHFFRAPFSGRCCGTECLFRVADRIAISVLSTISTGLCTPAGPGESPLNRHPIAVRRVGLWITRGLFK